MFITTRSKAEKKYWWLSLAVVISIYLPLFFGGLIIDLFNNQNVQALIFASGLVLVGVTILFYALNVKIGKLELITVIGMMAVYLMFFLRLGLAERSHLIEYSILAIFVCRALEERIKPEGIKFKTAALAVSISFGIGIIDELIQIFIPHRVFDFEDIFFNGSAIIVAIGFRFILLYLSKFRSGKK